MLVHIMPSWLMAGQKHTHAYRERSFFTMGSIATVCAYGDTTRQIDRAINKVIEEFNRLDGLLSVYMPTSEISRINASAGSDSAAVSSEVVTLIREMKVLAEQTGGAFDMTVEPLMRLWGFRNTPRSEVPSDSEISAVLDAVGNNHVFVDESEGRVGLDHPASRIDSGGWGVGYAVDRAVAILKAEGISSALVNHSGDARTFGIPEEQEGWAVAIPNPEHPDEMLKTVRLQGCAISTSGDYERFVTINSMRYGHLMNVRNGHPETTVSSVTIFAGTSLTADVTSTASACSFEMLSRLESLPGLSYIVVQKGPEGLNVREFLRGDVQAYE
jgi:thiamine biosynthesis lipoprotein